MFDGVTYVKERDEERLTGQLRQVAAAMSGGHWYTLKELTERCNGSEAAISARLRDLRKERFGSNYIESRFVSKGLWEYRMILKD